MSYKIHQLDIDGFRGINTPISLKLEGNTTIISSLNGRGKTSILRAIEFALFGDVMEMSGSDYSRGRYEISNKFTNKDWTTVCLRLTNDTSTVEIERQTKVDKGGSSLSKLEINGKEIAKNKEQKLHAELGIDHEEFHLLGYLTQSNFQKLLKYKPKRRSESFAKLLGTDRINEYLDQYTDALRSVGDLKKAFEKDCETANNERDELESKLNKAQKDLDDTYQELKVHGTDKDTFNTAIKELLTEYFDTIPETRDAQLSRIRELIDTDQPQKSTHALNSEQLLSLRDLITQLESDVTEFQELSENLKEIDLEELNNQKDSLGEKRSELEEEINTTNKYITFFEMAVDDILDQTTKHCPICDNHDFEVNKIKGNLRSKLQQLDSGNEVAALQDQKDTLNVQFEQLNDRIKHIKSEKSRQTNLENKIRELYNQLDSLDQMETISFQHLNKIDDIANELKPLKSAIDTFLKEIEENSGDNSRYRDLIKCRDLLKIALKINEIKQSIQQLDSKFKGKETKINQLNKTITGYETALDQLSQTQEYLVDKQQELINHKMNTLNPLIKKIYNKVDAHPVWNELVIETDTKKWKKRFRTEFNFNTRQTGNAENVTLNAYFSQGQANRSVLALIFAISQVNQSKLGFQLLDDITQSLDSEIIDNLVEVLTEMGMSKQIILATSDDRLEQSYQSTLEQSKLAHNHLKLGNWDKQGVSIEKLNVHTTLDQSGQ